MVGVAAAASLLVAMTVWADPPAWANVVWAIVNTIERFTVGAADVEPVEQVVVDGNVANMPVADEQVIGELVVEQQAAVDDRGRSAYVGRRRAGQAGGELLLCRRRRRSKRLRRSLRRRPFRK